MTEKYYLENFKDFTVITLRLYDKDKPHWHRDWLVDCNKIVDLLNELHKENTHLKFELYTHKHPLWSTREAERKVSELTELLGEEIKKNGMLLKENNLLKIENMRLKEDYKQLHRIESRLRVRIKELEHKELEK